MSIPKTALKESGGTPNAGPRGLGLTPEFAVDPFAAENSQRALLNILEDFAAEKSGLERGQRAVFNILEDFDAEKAGMEGAQRAVLNILDDFSEEKSRLEETQRAVLNILDDFETGKNRVEQANQQLKSEVEERKRAEEQTLRVNREVVAANKELEAFSYSVSHDLRSPLRGIDGFSLALLEEYGDKLDEEGKDYLRRVRAGTQRMGILIDDLLSLSRVTRLEIRLGRTNLGIIARNILAELQKLDPERRVEFRTEEGIEAFTDSHLITIALENLLGNAWKFTSKQESALIEFGTTRCDGELTFYVRDNGAGFDPAYAHQLFGAFQRLHDKDDFPGTGVGLATVQRIIHRQGGRIWAESAVDQGATFYFTLPETTHGGLNDA